MSPTDLPNDDLHVDQRVEGTAVVVRATGDIDMATAPVLAKELAHATKTVTPPTLIVADLREVQFFGSSGIGTLILAHQQCQKRNITLRVVAGPSLTKRLDISGLMGFLTIYLTLTEALDSSDRTA
jgi:anti-anti-sigma factor